MEPRENNNFEDGFEYVITVTKIKKTKPKTLIGRKYYPVDNSYQKFISGENIGDPYLAGCWNEKAQETIIVSEPYNETLEFFREKINHAFVNVLYKNSIYRVLYFEKGLEKR